MNESRLERLLGLVQAGQVDRSLPVAVRICLACPDALAIDGAGLSLVTASSHRSVGASDDVAEAIENAQASFHEGPCLEAIETRHPAFESDLASSAARRRWPMFSTAVLELGARAVYGFPLIVDREPIGALDIYSRVSRPLSSTEVDDALILADMAALAVRTSQESGKPDDIQQLSTEPEQGWAHLAVVHHASGMTAVQLGISVDEAMLRLRAFAFASERSVADVAGDIVNRRLRLDAWNRE
jgi:GAF domain